jgi:ectoine hydroxylase-related dioxygenase (phytanoyl-CoA dioxygenase family)
MSITHEPQVDVDFYKENGYLLVSGLFNQTEIEALQQETTALLERASNAGRNMEATWGGEWRERVGVGTLEKANTKVDSIHNVQYQSALFTRLLVDPRLTDIAAALIGPNVQLHHTKLHAKPPAIGSPFPLHQDYPYFPHQLDTMIAMIVHIDDATVENGCVCVVPGSHKLGGLEHEGSFYLSLDEWPLEKAVPVPAKAGDVLIFSYFMVHGSYVNRSDRPRRIVLFQLRSPEDQPLTEQHRSPGQGLMLRGINPDVLRKIV